MHDTLPPVPPVHCTSVLQLRLVPEARARGTLHGCLRVLIVDQFPPRVFSHWIKGYKSPCTCLTSICDKAGRLERRWSSSIAPTTSHLSYIILILILILVLILILILILSRSIFTPSPSFTSPSTSTATFTFPPPP